MLQNIQGVRPFSDKNEGDAVRFDFRSRLTIMPSHGHQDLDACLQVRQFRFRGSAAAASPTDPQRPHTHPDSTER